MEMINQKRLFSLLPYFFSNPQKLIPELVQNAQRAGASSISIRHNEKANTLTVRDNGAGCRDWRSLIVLADSDWDRGEVEDENPAGWGLYFLYSLAKNVEITSLFGKVSMDCAFLKDVEHAKDHISVSKGRGSRGLKLKAHLLPDVQLDASAIEQDLAYFPLQITLDGKIIKREKFCKGKNPILKGTYQGNRYSISNLNPGFYTDDDDFRRQLSVCWYGYPIRATYPHIDQTTAIDVRHGSPLTPVLPYREAVKMDEKLTRLREFLREQAIKTCLRGLVDRKLDTRELRDLSRLLAGIAPQEELDRAERFVVDAENPLDQEDYWDSGIEPIVVEKKNPTVIEILPEIAFPDLDVDDMVAVGLDCMAVLTREQPGWLKVEQSPYRIEVVPVMERKVDGWIDRRFVQAKILLEDKEIEAAFADESTVVYSSYSALCELARHIFNRWFYYDDGDTYDTQWYEFERAFDRQVHEIRGFLPRAQTISSLGEVLGKDLQGVTAIHIKKNRLELVGSKGTEVLAFE